MRKWATTMIPLAAASAAFAAPPLMRTAGRTPDAASYATAWGVSEDGYSSSFSTDGAIAIGQIASSVPCNIAYSGDAVTATIQLCNLSRSEQAAVSGRWLFVPDTLRTVGDDVFNISIEGGAPIECGSVATNLQPSAVAHFQVAVPLPESFGAGALLFEREDSGARLFAAHFARCVNPANPPGQRLHQICMDLEEPAVVSRLQTAPNRIGVAFLPPEDPKSEAYYAGVSEQLRAIAKTGYPVTVEFGAGPLEGNYMPLGRGRPHLDGEGRMLRTKQDLAWLPSWDGKFKDMARRIVMEFGWPRGPVNAVKLWNEPWNGISISGWGADDLRYREIFAVLCEAVDEARTADPSLQVLVGGCDSSSNTADKLFPDGDLRFLPYLDFMSLHYQGLGPSNPRILRDRKGPRGRTLFWDTESWVANSPDRVPAALAGMLAAGHDRVVGIQGYAVVATPYDADAIDPATGEHSSIRLAQAWPVAPALAAFQRFVGNRRFDGLAWRGLPWVWRFRGEEEEDLTLVVCGDISPVFDGNGKSGNVPFWTAKMAGGMAVKAVEKGRMAVKCRGAKLYDGNGNLVARSDGDDGFSIPLSDAGYYLRPSGEPGGARELLAALGNAWISGVPAIEPALIDATAQIGEGAVFRARLRNLTNRALEGTIRVKTEGLKLSYDPSIAIPPHEAVDVPLRVVAGSANAQNSYPFQLEFKETAGEAGGDAPRRSSFSETLHVNLVANGAPSNTDDFETWKTLWPQPVAAGGQGATQMERAWLPMLKHDTGPAAGDAVAWLRADDKFLYFAAQIADITPDSGMPRFATRDEDADFYPETAYDAREAGSGESSPAVRAWPSGVRRFSYRRRPELPNGAAPAHDNVQLAFNVLPDDTKPWHPVAPGTFKGYAAYWDTDWEFALNSVAAEFGGGTEVWTLRAPELPDKHFYPRSPKHPAEGPAAGAVLRTWRDATNRFVTCALPWSAFPALGEARSAGRPFRFSFRVNDNGAPGTCMELASGRSVSKRNFASLKPDWAEHWANEVEFGWERP